MKKISCAAVSALVLLFSVSVSAKEKTKTQRNGNIETVEVKDGDELLYRLVYTYEGDRKVRGEYWEAAPKKKKDKAKPNIFTGTALAVKYEAQLKDANLSDDSGVNLDVEKDGMILKFVKIVRYAKPVPVIARIFEQADANAVVRAGGHPVLTSEAAMQKFLGWFEKSEPAEAPSPV